MAISNGRLLKLHEGKEDAVIEPALAQHCPRCGGCRFIRIELPKEAEAALAAADTT